MTNPYENFDPSKYPLDTTGFWETWPEHEDPLNYPHPVFEKIISELKPNIILELGSYKGKSAIQFANICKKLNLNTKIYCVDTWLGSAEHAESKDLMKVNGWPTMFYQFLANVMHTGHQDCIIPMPIDTMSNYRSMKESNVKVPLIYIDAGHFYESVYSDIKYYWEVLEDGGIMFGDDYEWEGVSAAVKDFFGDKVSIIPSDQSSSCRFGENWMIQKSKHEVTIVPSNQYSHEHWMIQKSKPEQVKTDNNSWRW